MQGNAGGATFSIMDTVDDLGCRIEFSGPASGAGGANLRQTGTLLPDSPGIVDLEIPIFSGGKRINQVGLVVQDEKKAARRFEELLGIKGWNYAYGPPNLFNASLNGKPAPESAMESLDVAFAMGWMGDIQIEIIRPIGIRPGGCHQVFLDKHGNGIQHVSFGIQPDYREFIDGMKKAGIGVEFSASIKDHGVSAAYFASQDQLGGFQLEIVGKT
jgi:catechol 2,3-dioxygenase-like lactoylglutathione lyase family enzyme